MSDRFLMCKPQYFDVQYVINPWMQNNLGQVKPALAKEQWESFLQLLTQYAQIELIAPSPDLPDLVFCANAGLLYQNKVLLSNFRYPERQAEAKHFSTWFAEQGFELEFVAQTFYFEGAGDALFDRSLPLLWMGHGFRTDLACAEILANFCQMEVVALHLIDPYFYHLDTCFCPLSNGYLMYYPAAFDENSQALIEKYIPASKRIIVQGEDAKNFACNAVYTDCQIFLNPISTTLKQQLSDAGLTVHCTEFSEFIRAGGAAKCLTLKLTEPNVFNKADTIVFAI